MTTDIMIGVYDGLEKIGEVPYGSLPALIRCRKRPLPRGGCEWSYEVYGPDGHTLLAVVDTHQAARRVALAHGYLPLECWIKPPHAEEVTR